MSRKSKKRESATRRRTEPHEVPATLGSSPSLLSRHVLVYTYHQRGDWGLSEYKSQQVTMQGGSRSFVGHTHTTTHRQHKYTQRAQGTQLSRAAPVGLHKEGMQRKRRVVWSGLAACAARRQRRRPPTAWKRHVWNMARRQSWLHPKHAMRFIAFINERIQIMIEMSY